MADEFVELKPVEDGFPVLPSSNGHQMEKVETPENLPLPHLDVARRVFITSRREEIELSDTPISALILERIANEGKPKIPLKEVTLMGKIKQLEAHPEDPAYVALLAEWEAENKIRSMKYLYCNGVKGEPPAEFVESQLEWFPNADNKDMKYIWVCHRVPDDDIDIFIEAVTGQSTPTQKGMEEVANFTG